MRLVRLIACLVAGAAILSACESSSDKAGGSARPAAVVFRFAGVSGVPPQPVLAWIETVERRSHGSIRIDVL